MILNEEEPGDGAEWLMISLTASSSRRDEVFGRDRLGIDHPDMVLSLENYAMLLRKMNRDDETARLETMAEEIRAKANLTNPN
jgi:hypothetical protein